MGSTLCDFDLAGAAASSKTCPDCDLAFDVSGVDTGTGCLPAWDAVLGYYEDYNGYGEYLSFALYGVYELGPFPAELTTSGGAGNLYFGGYAAGYATYFYTGDLVLK